MDFPIQATISGNIEDAMNNKALLERLYADEYDLDMSMDAESERRFEPEIQKIIPGATVYIKNTESSQLVNVSPTRYIYTILYILTIKTDVKITKSIYDSLVNSITNELTETIHYANYDRMRKYNITDDSSIELKVLNTLEATKANIKARTAEAGLLGLNLPKNVIGKMANYIGNRLPVGAPRSRPLAAPLTNKRLEAIQVAEHLPTPEAMPKKPWYKFWGGKRKTMRKSKSKRKHIHKKRKSNVTRSRRH